MGFDNLPLTALQTGIFPHLYMKNVKCKVNFRKATRWFDSPGDQVKFFEEALVEEVVANPVEHSYGRGPRAPGPPSAARGDPRRDRQDGSGCPAW